MYTCRDAIVEYTFDLIAAIYRSCSLSRVIDLKNSLGICTCFMCKEWGRGCMLVKEKTHMQRANVNICVK